MKKPATLNVIQTFENTLMKRGPKPKITKFTRRLIKSFVNENNMNVAHVTWYQIKLREIKCLQYNYGNMPVKHMLTSNKKKKKMIFCKYYSIKNFNWSNVFFSDEKRFILYACDYYYSWFQGNKSLNRV